MNQILVLKILANKSSFWNEYVIRGWEEKSSIIMVEYKKKKRINVTLFLSELVKIPLFN